MHLSTRELEFCNYQDRDKTISRDSYIIGEESFRDQMFYLFSLLRHIRVMEIASPCAIVAHPTLHQGEACVKSKS